jgi:glycosyltransferase involved in cell wall biosynthesis
MTPRLSILIPTIPGREHFMDRIMKQVSDQAAVWPEVEVQWTIGTPSVSIGMRRNELMARATGDYICFIDDDDRVADNYIELVMAGIATNPDCCSLNGIITTDGKNPKPFKHSIDYDSMYERDGVYYRPPNHLNTVRSSIAKQMVFPDWDRSEDSNYCFQLRDSGLLRVEYKIEPVLYYYDYVSDKNY